VTTRDDKRLATRRHIVSVAVDSLVEVGVSGSTTLAIQARAGLSRGALLHHFPTRESLLGAAVEELLGLNLALLREGSTRFETVDDPVLRGLRVMHAGASTPSFGAELELWSAARTNAELRRILRAAEGPARVGLRLALDEIFGPEVTGEPGYQLALEFTVHLVRGMAASSSLRGNKDPLGPVLEEWAAVFRGLLMGNPNRQALPSAKRKKPKAQPMTLDHGSVQGRSLNDWSKTKKQKSPQTYGRRNS
jgi:AcrR family transcriptional regulator